MGSDSDLPVMKDAANILNMFDVLYEVNFLFTIFWAVNSGLLSVSFIITLLKAYVLRLSGENSFCPSNT